MDDRSRMQLIRQALRYKAAGVPLNDDERAALELALREVRRLRADEVLDTVAEIARTGLRLIPALARPVERRVKAELSALPEHRRPGLRRVAGSL